MVIDGDEDWDWCRDVIGGSGWDWVSGRGGGGGLGKGRGWDWGWYGCQRGGQFRGGLRVGGRVGFPLMDA